MGLFLLGEGDVANHLLSEALVGEGAVARAIDVFVHLQL